MKTPASLGQLPAELHHMIVGYVLQDKSSTANLAAVSRQWQNIVEPYNFARITLTPSRLLAFNQMTLRNRSLVRYLWLRIEVKKKTEEIWWGNAKKRAKRRAKRRAQDKTEDDLLSATFQKLLFTLSK